ncbi:hypothetical protein Trydic_g9845 [Trypoxylus dichotomus]
MNDLEPTARAYLRLSDMRSVTCRTAVSSSIGPSIVVIGPILLEFHVFSCRLTKLQQHWLVIVRELVENGELMKLGDALHNHDIQDVGLSIEQEYRGLNCTVYHKVVAVGKTA